MLCSRLNEIKGIKLHKPDGAFYALARLDLHDAEEFAIFMLKTFRHKNETVFIAPGGGFYMGAGRGKNKARIAFVLNQSDLLRAGELLELGFKQFSEQKA